MFTGFRKVAGGFLLLVQVRDPLGVSWINLLSR